MTDSWWFPIAAMVFACFALTVVAGHVNALISPRGRSLIGGTIIMLIAIACLVRYAYAIWSPPTPVDLPLQECLGPPYEVC